MHQSMKTGLFTLAILFSCKAFAEVPVQRDGVFAQSVKTPECDGIVDHLDAAGNLVRDGLEYGFERALKTVEGVGRLAVYGDHETLFDEVNDTFSDLGGAAASLGAYTPLGLSSLLIDVLPDGAVTEFLSTGANFALDLQKVVMAGVVEGVNPLAAVETVKNDLIEIAGDVGNVLVNLDDPLSAGNEFLKLQQKWNAAGALTYMLTEDNPMDGMKKALGALHRQVELVTSHVPGAAPNGKVAGALFDHVMEQSKEAIDSMGSAQEKKIATVMMAAFATSFKQSVSDPNYDPGKSSSRHPFYYAEIRTVEAEWMGDDHNSGGKYDWGMDHPMVENRPGCISLGDTAYSKKRNPTLKAVCNVEEGRNVWWARPIDYQLVWGDNCSGATHDRSIWRPVCPQGFVGVGVVAYGGSWQKPLPNRIACLKNDLNLINAVDGNSAQLQWVANDSGSGAKYDVTVLNRQFAGMTLTHAVRRKIGKNDRSLFKDMTTAVEVPGTAPPPSQSECVNFYSETNHSGRTTTICNPCEDHNSINTQCGNQSIAGQNNQTFENIGSLQCGDEVAAVLLSNGREQAVLLACDESFGGSWRTEARYATLLKRNIYNPSKEFSKAELERRKTQLQIVSSQWNVGDQVEVLEDDGRWTAASVMERDSRSGVLIRYEDSYEQMWVPENLLRVPASGQAGASGEGSQLDSDPLSQITEYCGGNTQCVSDLENCYYQYGSIESVEFEECGADWQDTANGQGADNQTPIENTSQLDSDLLSTAANTNSSSTSGTARNSQLSTCEEYVSEDLGSLTNVTFINNGRDTLYFYWIDYDGNETNYNNTAEPALILDSGQSSKLQAYIGYVFSVNVEQGADFVCTGDALIEQENQTIEIGDG